MWQKLRRYAVLSLALALVIVAGNAAAPAFVGPLEASTGTGAPGGGPLAAPLAAPVLINPGHDLLETDPDNTHQDLAIPAGFFGPGCDPFNGRVQFMGVPMDSFLGQSGLLPTDTVVRRNAPGLVPDPPGDVVVPIEIVALHLMSVQPIVLTCAGGSSSWNIEVEVDSTTPQQQGQMKLKQTGPLPGNGAGGTFESTLPVQPRMTFHRVGSAQNVVAPPQPPLVFNATGPWCVSGNPLDEPAGEEVVEAPPVTSNFFLGMECTQPTVAGPVVRKKVLTIEQAALARHGVLVAERKPHYKCYAIFGDDQPQVVNLQTQFGIQNAVPVGRPRLLCPPAKKTLPGKPTEGTFNVPHQKCYGIQGHDPNAVVRLEDQFNVEIVQVGRARLLCLAALKTHVPNPLVGPPPAAPHYECYSIEGKPVDRTVKLETQFGVENNVVVLKPLFLCAPALVTIPGQPAIGTLKAPHIKCYDIIGHDPAVRVNLRTRFGDELNVDVAMAELLCTPVKKKHIPNCVLNQAVSHAAGVTTVQWQVGASVPTTWKVHLILGGSPTQILSVPIPAIDPPILVGPISIPFPAVGNVSWLTTLSTPADGIICHDITTVFTGDPLGAPAAVLAEELQLPELIPGLPES